MALLTEDTNRVYSMMPDRWTDESTVCITVQEITGFTMSNIAQRVRHLVKLGLLERNWRDVPRMQIRRTT